MLVIGKRREESVNITTKDTVNTKLDVDLLIQKRCVTIQIVNVQKDILNHVNGFKGREDV